VTRWTFFIALCLFLPREKPNSSICGFGFQLKVEHAAHGSVIRVPITDLDDSRTSQVLVFRRVSNDAQSDVRSIHRMDHRLTSLCYFIHFASVIGMFANFKGSVERSLKDHRVDGIARISSNSNTALRIIRILDVNEFEQFRNLFPSRDKIPLDDKGHIVVYLSFDG